MNLKYAGFLACWYMAIASINAELAMRWMHEIQGQVFVGTAVFFFGMALVVMLYALGESRHD